MFTGMRPGEKLFEELQYSGESIDKTRHPKIYIGKIAGVPADELAFALSRLRELASGGRPTRSGRSWGRSCRKRR